ncbi:MAG: VOC family protein [Bryobacteraceae bacterium]
MRRFALLILAAPLLVSQELPLDGYAHAGFRACDLAATRHYYAEVLGFEEVFAKKDEKGSVQIAFFKVNEDQYLELSPNLPPGEDVRLTHIAIQTADIAGLRRLLQARGLDVPEPKKSSDGNLNFSLRDPENLRVEFVEYQFDSMQRRAKGAFMTRRRVSTHLQHTGVIIPAARLAQALKFYRDQLGLVETWRNEPTPGDVRLVKLRIPGQGRDVVELMVNHGLLTRQRIGAMHHINLEVPDIHAAYRFLGERHAPGVEKAEPRVNIENILGNELFRPRWHADGDSGFETGAVATSKHAAIRIYAQGNPAFEKERSHDAGNHRGCWAMPAGVSRSDISAPGGLHQLTADQRQGGTHDLRAAHRRVR